MPCFLRWACLGAATVLSTFACTPVWPGASSAGAPRAVDLPSIHARPVCIATEGWSAGELGRTILYRYRREQNRLEVGYFVYWSTERPWGNNALTYALLPALV